MTVDTDSHVTVYPGARKLLAEARCEERVADCVKAVLVSAVALGVLLIAPK